MLYVKINFREVQILIEAYNCEEVKLFVSYVVNDAGWVPKYDLRVHSRDKNLKVRQKIVQDFLVV